MKSVVPSLLAIWLAIGLSFLFPGLTLAQTAQGPQAPEHYTVDGNYVDVIRGTYNLTVTDVTVGPEAGGISYTRTYAGDVNRSNIDGLVEVEVAAAGPGFTIYAYTASIGAASDRFLTQTAGTMTSASGNGTTLSFDGTYYTHIDGQGVVRIFDPALADPKTAPSAPNGPGGRIVQMTRPSGERWDWHYRSSSSTFRVQSVTSNRGYQLKFEYDPLAFTRQTRVLGINNAVDYCNPTADTCASLSTSWPSATYALTSPTTTTRRLDVTNALSQTTRYEFLSSQVIDAPLGLPTLIDWPEPNRASTVITYGALDRVSAVSDGRGTWTYAYVTLPAQPNTQTTTVTAPNSHVATYRARLRTGPSSQEIEQQRLTWVTDALGNITYTRYDSQGRLSEVTAPEGNVTRYTRDGRGNITEIRQTAKPGAPVPDLVQTWTYASTCVNRQTCNLPTAFTDASLNTTDYTYDAASNLLTKTGSAPMPGAARPQTRYTWEQRYAWYKQNGTSAITRAPSPVWVQTGSSQCMTGATC